MAKKLTKIKSDNTITLSEIKRQLIIDDDYNDDDDYLKSLLNVATEFIENYINMDILLTEYTMNDIDDDSIYLSPLYSFDKLMVDDVEVEVEVDEYVNHFELKYDKIDGVKNISFTCGYDVIPYVLKQAILIKVNDLYDVERNDKVIGLSINTTNAIKDLTSNYKRKYY